MKKIPLIVSSLLALVFSMTSCKDSDKNEPLPSPYDLIMEGIAYRFTGINQIEVAAITQPSDYSGNIIIPETVQTGNKILIVSSIGEKAFYKSSITGIIFPETLTQIGDEAFYGCEGLKELVLPSSVVFIGNYAFSSSGIQTLTVETSEKPLSISTGFDATPIQTATIGRDLKGMWNSTHLDDLILQDNVGEFSITLSQPLRITSLSKIPPALTVEADDEIFSESVVYVPANSIDAYYDASGWNKFLIVLAYEQE